MTAYPRSMSLHQWATCTMIHSPLILLSFHLALESQMEPIEYLFHPILNQEALQPIDTKID